MGTGHWLLLARCLLKRALENKYKVQQVDRRWTVRLLTVANWSRYHKQKIVSLPDRFYVYFQLKIWTNYDPKKKNYCPKACSKLIRSITFTSLSGSRSFMKHTSSTYFRSIDWTSQQVQVSLAIWRLLSTHSCNCPTNETIRQQIKLFNRIRCQTRRQNPNQMKNLSYWNAPARQVWPNLTR